MKVKVLRKFIDRQEKAVRQPGEVFECTAERYNEIMSKNRLIEAVEEDESENEAIESKEPAPDQKATGTEKPEKAKITTKKK